MTHVSARPPRTPARWIAFLAVAIAAGATVLTGIWDPDFFHHLAVGRAIARGTSFAHEPFLWPLADAPSGIPQYWLGSLALYVASVPAGPSGAVLLTGVVAAALYVILLADATDGTSQPHRLLVAVALLALALPELRIRSAPRPEAFAIMFLALTLLAARRFELGKRRLLVAVPLIALVWTQVHVSVAMGLGVMALLVASIAGRAILDRARGSTGSIVAAIRVPVAVLAAAILATALTPSPASPVKLAWRFLASSFGGGGVPAPAVDDGMGQIIDMLRGNIVELRAPTLAEWATRPFGILVAIALLSFVVHRSRGWVRELLTIAAFAAFTATALRFAAIASFVAAPIAARNLGSWLDRLRERRPRLVLAAPALAVCAAVAVAAASPIFRNRAGLDLAPGMYPVRAAEYLRQIGFDGRLYNDFTSGGYLEWTLDRPVFQDGRGALRPQDLADVMPQPVDPERMARLDARHRFDALVMGVQFAPDADPAAVARVRAQGFVDRATWSLVAFDERAAVFLRRDGRFGPVAARDEYRLVGPDASVAPDALRDPRTRVTAIAELARAAREAPGCASCRVALADVLLEENRLADVAAIVAELRALDLPWWRPSVEMLAATVAMRRGDAAEAEARYRAAMRVADRPEPVRRMLASFLAAQGRHADAAQLVDQNLGGGHDPEDLRLAVALARASGDLSRAAALEPRLAEAERRAWARARTNAGAALAQAGRQDEALAAFAEALRADERCAPARTYLGLVLLSRGEDAAAFAHLSRAVQDEPELAEAWFALAQARERRGDRAGALDGYRRYVALRHGGEWMAAARARIAALTAGR